MVVGAGTDSCVPLRAQPGVCPTDDSSGAPADDGQTPRGRKEHQGWRHPWVN